MNREEAKKFLDAIKDGIDETVEVINECLESSGDRGDAGIGSEGMEAPIPPEDWRGRVRQRAIMVAASLR